VLKALESRRQEVLTQSDEGAKDESTKQQTIEIEDEADVRDLYDFVNI
jgi:hypothetical protein